MYVCIHKTEAHNNLFFFWIYELFVSAQTFL